MTKETSTESISTERQSQEADPHKQKPTTSNKTREKESEGKEHDKYGSSSFASFSSSTTATSSPRSPPPYPTTNTTTGSSSSITTGTSTTDEESSNRIRTFLGHVSTQASDLVHAHLILARYATLTGIGIVTLYGISQSPLLFFRYRTAADLPVNLFRSRAQLHGRLLLTRRIHPYPHHTVDTTRTSPTTTSSTSTADAVVTSLQRPRLPPSVSPNSRRSMVHHNNKSPELMNRPIRLQIRHLSFFEKWFLMSDRWFETYTKQLLYRLQFYRPSTFLTNQITGGNHPRSLPSSDCLTVELAGVTSFPMSIPVAAAATDPHHRYDNPQADDVTDDNDNDDDNDDGTGGLLRQLLLPQQPFPRVTVELLEPRFIHAEKEEDGGGEKEDNEERATTVRVVPAANDEMEAVVIAKVHCQSVFLLHDRESKTKKKKYWFQKVRLRSGYSEDLALWLVRSGRALAMSSSATAVVEEEKSHRDRRGFAAVVPTVEQLRDDAQYAVQLGAAETDAAFQRRGFWKSLDNTDDPDCDFLRIMRDIRPDLIEDIERDMQERTEHNRKKNQQQQQNHPVSQAAAILGSWWEKVGQWIRRH